MSKPEINALRAAQIAINSMKQEAEAAAQLDEEAMLEAMEKISQEGLEADTAIRAVLDTPAASRAATPTATEAMVDAYLLAQRRAVEEADRFGRPNVGGLHANTVREACRAGILAALEAAQPASPAPLTDEQRRAVKEGERIASADTYFRLRHPMLDTRDRRNVFEAAFDRGYDAALASPQVAPEEKS